jgi:hypothetical protein
MRWFAIALASASPFLLVFADSPAQDASKDAARQKAAAAALLKKADFGASTIVESEHFLVAGTLAEDRAKALGAVLDKVVPVVRKALQFEAKEAAWKGKLAVFHLPESRDFKGFMRSAIVTQPDGVHYSIRSDEPFLVDPVETTGKATESDQFAQTAGTVAGAYLKAKGSGAAIPDWLVTGFGRATAMRAEGTGGKRYLAYRTAARGIASRGGRPSDLWGEIKPSGADTLAASFADYLAHGPGAANFVKLVNGFRPDDNGNTPPAPAALEAAGWKDVSMLEAAWRKWAAK